MYRCGVLERLRDTLNTVRLAILVTVHRVTQNTASDPKFSNSRSSLSEPVVDFQVSAILIAVGFSQRLRFGK